MPGQDVDTVPPITIVIEESMIDGGNRPAARRGWRSPS
jgi:hypothetical protein